MIYPALQIFMGNTTGETVTTTFTHVADFLNRRNENLLLMILISIGLTSVFLRIYLQYLIAFYSHHIGLNLSSQIVTRILNGRFEATRGIDNSRLLSVLGRKSNETVGSVFVPLLSGISALTNLTTIFLLLLLSLGTSVALSTGLIIIFFLLQYLFFKPLIRRLGKKYSDIQNLHILQINEIHFGNREIRIYKIATKIVQRFRSYDWSLRNSQIKIFIVSITPKALIDAILSCAALSLPIVAYNNGLAAEKIIPIIGVIGMVILRVLPQVSNLYASFISIQGGLASLDDVTQIIKSIPSAVETLHRDKSNGPNKLNIGVKITGLNLRYTSDAPNVFSKDLDFKINPGQKVALVGPNGSGKSTLLDLIMALVSPTVGTISYVDTQGIEVNEIPRISLVPQNVLIIADTLRNNLAFGCNYDDQSIINALKLVGLGAWNLDKPLQEGGNNLSGGQKQRISIARALIRSPSLLILDEFTSAVDQATSLQLYKIIQSLESTVIVVSHDTKVLDYTDKVIRLENA